MLESKILRNWFVFNLKEKKVAWHLKFDSKIKFRVSIKIIFKGNGASYAVILYLSPFEFYFCIIVDVKTCLVALVYFYNLCKFYMIKLLMQYLW